MLYPVIITALSLLALLSPSSAHPTTTFQKRTAGSLLAIAPKANTCANATFPKECKTASEAAPFINHSFATYGITTAGEAAAVVAIMAFESGDFKYNINHFPGRPGQGTRNMQSPALNLLVRAGLKTGSLAGWKAYVTDCVHTTATPERQAYWDRAAKALGVASSS
ncbi:MAG: hypothetical protein Q9222_001176 [Ikaeria aurantiellina]